MPASLRPPLLTMAAIILSGAILYMGTGMPGDPAQHADAGQAALEQELAEIRGRRSATDAELATQRQEAASATALAQVVFNDDDPAASLASMQEDIHAALAAHGGVLVSSQPGSQILSEDVARLQVLLRARLDETGLFELLKAVEEHEPRVLVDALEVRPLNGIDGQPPLDVVAVFVAFNAHAI